MTRKRQERSPKGHETRQSLVAPEITNNLWSTAWWTEEADLILIMNKRLNSVWQKSYFTFKCSFFRNFSLDQLLLNYLTYSSFAHFLTIWVGRITMWPDANLLWGIDGGGSFLRDLNRFRVRCQLCGLQDIARRSLKMSVLRQYAQDTTASD